MFWKGTRVAAEPDSAGFRPPRARLSSEEVRGLLNGMGAFLAWGCIPIYFKWLSTVPPIEIIAHRAVWSLLFVLVIILITRRQRQLLDALRDPRKLAIFVATTLLIAANWLLYVWAVNNDRILETSLGYYINPLVNVLLGMLIFKERLNRWQTAAILFAVVAVAIMTFEYGVLPWVSLGIAFSFGFYGMFRKMVPVDSTVGLTVETLLMFPFALGYLLYLTFAAEPLTTGEVTGGFHYEGWTLVLLLGTGIVTAVPLIMFATAARRLTLTTVGLLQYLAPSLTALLAVFVYGEPFGETRVIAFGLIWVGLVIYTVDGIRRRRG